jgi:hypothetical protein
MSISLEVVVKELRVLRQQRAVGTYYIVSADNRQVRFGIAAGEVVSFSVRSTDLATAFDAIAKLDIVRTRFAEDVLTVGGGAIPLTTEQVYGELLRRAGAAVPAGARAGGAGADKAPLFLPPAQSRALRQLVIEYLGPIGDLVLEEHMAAAGSADSLLKGLAAEISDRRRAATFLERARPLLSDPG